MLNIKTGLCYLRYVSCVLGCPYEGYIQPKAVAEVYIAHKALTFLWLLEVVSR